MAVKLSKWGENEPRERHDCLQSTGDEITGLLGFAQGAPLDLLHIVWPK